MSLFKMVRLASVLLFLIVVNVIALRKQPNVHEYHYKVYPLIVDMMERASETHSDLPPQYVAALLLSPQEFKDYESGDINKKYSQRFDVYINIKKKQVNLHGEELLLRELDEKYLNDYNRKTKYEPILFIYSTYIPCHRGDKSHCAQSLRTDVTRRRDIKKKTKVGNTYKLVIAFIGVWGKQFDNNIDFTELSQTIKYLTSDTEYISFAYFISTQDYGNLLQGTKEDQSNIIKNRDNYQLSSWVRSDSFETKKLRARFPITDPDMAFQHALIMCLEVFLGECSDFGKTVSDRAALFNYATFWAMKRCVDTKNIPNSCSNCINPLKGNFVNPQMNRNTLKVCLDSEWINRFGYIKSNQCRGQIKDVAKMCLMQAIWAQNVSCPYWNNALNWDIKCPKWNMGYNKINKRFLNIMCPNRSMRPELLCSVSSNSNIIGGKK